MNFRFLRFFICFLALISSPWLVRAAVVPGRYIVELSTDSVAGHVAMQPRRTGLRSAEAASHRARVLSEQQSVRSRVEQQGTVVDSTSTVANTLIVDIPDAAAAQLASIPGVKRVYPVRTFHMLLDRAVVVNKVVDAWSQIGMERAGAGVKIAIIDSGVDSSHPGFQDTSLQIPDSFPKVTSSSDLAYTNNKVIVARSYVNLLQSRDPDLSARDRVGHGTALAMVAAGVRNTGPYATITGVAPKAYIGNYKVFGTPGYNDNSSDDAILKAIDDAVADGMDVINLSLGTDLAPRLSDDLEAQALERATAAGVIVVAAAGNNGPGYNTMSSPATSPSVIAVGASRNDRTFGVTAQVSGFSPIVALPAGGSSGSGSVTGPLSDVASLDKTGQACVALPAGSLKGRIAMVLRGTCTFETKLNNAQQAGAIGALVYAAQDSPDPIVMGVGTATLPAEMISYPDGIAVKQGIAKDTLNCTLQFSLAAVPVDSTRMADFSGAGPSVDTGIKPDLLAVGTDIYVATETLDPQGDMYDPSGYILVDGTSFSSPIVAGVAALLKSARPGLTVDQYRSLIINSAGTINSATGGAATIQQTGAGVLNAGAALRGTATASPVSLSFGSGGGTAKLSRTLTITNLGAASDTFAVLVAPTGGDAGPTPATNTVQLAPGASTDVAIAWQANGLAAGSHEGVIRVVAAGAGTEARIPYWYDVASGKPAGITVLDSVTSGRRNSLSRDAILFRVVDGGGVALPDAQPTVTPITGGGTAQTVVSYDSDVPGMFGATVRLGPLAGTNTYRIQAGDVSVDVTIAGQ